MCNANACKRTTLRIPNVYTAILKERSWAAGRNTSWRGKMSITDILNLLSKVLQRNQAPKQMVLTWPSCMYCVQWKIDSVANFRYLHRLVQWNTKEPGFIFQKKVLYKHYSKYIHILRLPIWYTLSYKSFTLNVSTKHPDWVFWNTTYTIRYFCLFWSQLFVPFPSTAGALCYIVKVLFCTGTVMAALDRHYFEKLNFTIYITTQNTFRCIKFDITFLSKNSAWNFSNREDPIL